ncbi:ferritin-like domain-containing protein [Pleomorphovibrio marinus]|uniref:ferritin-like domain-containing protein n=1 Tax=Pleomorphovibrio marinus TaxID=2164132 RepID=UPI000E0C2114|nr:ferritin-like domain-containing protein [Pleomorphovibrio marinus]
MNIYQLLKSYNVKPESSDTYVTRRDAFAKLANFGKKAVMASVPLSLAAAKGNKATAKSMGLSNPVDVLNFALTLEYLEAQFYREGCSCNVIPEGRDRAIFNIIERHEFDHVKLLIPVIESLGGEPVKQPEFDFTAGGAFRPFSDYAQFLALSQAFEDTGVRAYKGQAANLMSNGDLLTAALQIHSVEARHASEVRRLRGIKGWITGDERGEGMPAATQAVYEGEDNLMQGGVDVRDVVTLDSIGTDGITESFDEPLTSDEVLTIAGLFIV